MARIPLSLVTGFLGSGKTTFLKHMAPRLASRRIVYLVNDFSALDVDGAVLSEIGPNVVSIPGGSIFCKCLVGDFIQHLSGSLAAMRLEWRGRRTVEQRHQW